MSIQAKVKDYIPSKEQNKTPFTLWESLRMRYHMSKFNRKLELIDGLETDYLRILYYDFSKPYQGTYKSYEYNRLCTIINGAKKVRVNDSEFFTYNEREFIILPPNSSINLEINIPTKALVVEIFNTLIDNITKKVSFEFETDFSSTTNKIFSGTEKSPFLNMIIEKILQTATSSDKNREFLMDLYAQEMTYNLLKTQYLQEILGSQSNNFTQLAIQMMKNNLLENITIDKIAHSFHMSPANFSTKFKNATGLPPNKYLTNLKLLNAKTQLKTKNVTEVAFDLGYENISHFIHLFKDKFGATPKQYVLKQNN